MNQVLIDTTQVTTDTIDYVATDQSGLTSTSTRTVVIEAQATSSAQKYVRKTQFHNVSAPVLLKSVIQQSLE